MPLTDENGNAERWCREGQRKIDIDECMDGPMGPYYCPIHGTMTMKIPSGVVIR